MTTRTNTRLLAAAALFVAASGAQASSLSVDLNNDTLHAGYKVNSDRAQLGVSVDGLFTDDEGEAFYLTAHTQGQLGNQENIRGGFGGRAYHIDPEYADSLQALALGGFISFAVPQLPDLSIGAEIYYAPSITVSDDWENVKHLELRVSYQLFENAAVYAGLRHFEAEFDAPAFVDDDVEFDDGFHLGFNMQF